MKPLIKNIMTKFKSQSFHIIRVKYWNAMGSGSPPFIISAHWNIDILHYKKAKLLKDMQYNICSESKEKWSKIWTKIERKKQGWLIWSNRNWLIIPPKMSAFKHFLKQNLGCKFVSVRANWKNKSLSIDCNKHSIYLLLI